MTPAARGHLAMLLFSALVAGSFSLGVLAANHISPSALTAARFGIASVIVGVASWMTGSLKRSAFEASWRYLLLGGIFACYFVLMFEGLKTAQAVSAAAVFTLIPVMSAVFGYILMRQLTTPRMALALAIGAVGAVWVIFRADMAAVMQFHIGQGEIVYFYGCIAHAIYAPLVRKLNRGESAMVFSFGTLVAGGILLTIWGWRDIVATDWLALPSIVWITLLYISVFASAITFVLTQFATLRLPAAKVMAYTYLTPTWVILFELALGNGAPPVMTILGVVLTVVALVLLLRE